jgi:GDP-L-fucose synthase
MDLESKIYVAGHLGLVGSAILRRLRSAGYSNLLLRSHRVLDLRQQQAVRDFFEAERPEYVFLAAAKVGGILANSTMGADFIYDNLAIEVNVLKAARDFSVKKLLFLGSSCIYPKLAPQPLKEEYLLTGALEPTNEPYAVAKIAGIKLCSAFNRQYGTNFLCVMPANLYGPGDNYDLQNSHVLPALIRKMHEAKCKGEKRVLVWGTGAPYREFLYADDLADACVYLMQSVEAKQIGEFINIGTGEDHTIRELARMVAEVVGFEGEIVYDSSKPDGTPRKLLDVSRLRNLGWQAVTPLKKGLQLAYEAYLGKDELESGL